MSKHYYIESDRIVSKIGGGFKHAPYDITEHVYNSEIPDYSHYPVKSDSMFILMMPRHFDSVYVNDDVVMDMISMKHIYGLSLIDEPEELIFWYHKDHLGSSTQITNAGAEVFHHMEYMPSGELFSEQRDWWSTPFKFNGKELDSETNLYYYGARYYTAMENIWLSVDPLASKYPSLSPYAYCAQNPVMLVDPDGRDIDPHAPGYNAAKNAATPGSSTYQPAFAELYKNWEKRKDINVKFINNVKILGIPNIAGTVLPGGEKTLENGTTQQIYEIYWDPSATVKLGTSAMFEESKHLQDGLDGKFNLLTGTGMRIINEIEAKQWVINNIKDIQGTYNEDGYQNRTHYGYFKANPTELTARNLGLGIKLRNRSLNPRLSGKDYNLFGTGGVSYEKMYISSILKLRHVKFFLNW
jgi:RHS repeat-associated protein